MRKLKMLIIIIVSLFMGNMSVLAESSNFETKINMEPEITENQVNLVLGFRGEETMAVKETITYDATKVNLLDIVAIDNFVITNGVESIDGKWHTITFLADSMYSFKDTNYAIVVFEVKDNFKVGKDSDVFLYNIEASGPDKTKFRSRGNYVALTRESQTSMYMKIDPIKDGAKIKYYLKKYLLLIVVAFIAVVAVIILFIICLPNFRKKENRTKAVNNSIKSDNYNSNSNLQPIKINQEEIDKLNENKKVVDLSKAIIVSDDIKPFGDNPSRENEGKKSEGYNKIEVPFDPFNVKIDDMSTMNIREITPVEEVPAKKQEIKENDLKAPVLTMDFSDDVSVINIEEDNNSKNSNNSNKINSILLLLAFSLISLFSMSVNALETINSDSQDSSMIDSRENSEKINELRNCIVGNITCDLDFDYNGDRKVDILDIIYTRNTVNVNFEELLETEPGFKELHGKSPNIIGSNSITKVIVNKRKTTTRKTTILNGSSSKKTTNKQNDDETTTTMVNTTIAKKTTISMPIDESITYQVNVNANNGLVNNSSTMNVNSGKNAIFIVIPNTGFEFASVSCTDGVRATYSKTDRRLKVASVKSNTTCTINFTPRTDIKVSINPTNGTSSPKSSYVTYKDSVYFTVRPNKGYKYVPNSLTCSNGISANYINDILTVNNVSEDTTCSLKFDKEIYTVRLYINNNLVDTEKLPFNELYYKKFENMTTSNGNLKCNGNTTSVKKTRIANNSYTWEFSKRVTENLDCFLEFN